MASEPPPSIAGEDVPGAAIEGMLARTSSLDAAPDQPHDVEKEEEPDWLVHASHSLFGGAMDTMPDPSPPADYSPPAVTPAPSPARAPAASEQSCLGERLKAAEARAAEAEYRASRSEAEIRRLKAGVSEARSFSCPRCNAALSAKLIDQITAVRCPCGHLFGVERPAAEAQVTEDESFPWLPWACWGRSPTPTAPPRLSTHVTPLRGSGSASARVATSVRAA